MQVFNPTRDPTQRVCVFCQATGAEKWDGGHGGLICHADGRMPTPITSVRYCCATCDVGNSWFDLEDADFTGDLS